METIQPLVSVVIPTYNRAHTIERAINGVRQQTYSNLEIIVVDDGSTDDTQSRLGRLGDGVRVFRQSNKGPAAARNRGIQEARGNIIAFQDSDDHWHPEKIERQVELLEKVGPSVPCCFANAAIHTDSGLTPLPLALDSSLFPDEQGLWLNPAEVLATRCLFFNQVVAVRREALEKVGGFNPNLRYFEEWDLALKLCLLGPWAYIREPLTYWTPDSSESVTEGARRNAACLHECSILLLKDMLSIFNTLEHAPVRKRLQRTLQKSQRMLSAIRLRDRGSFGPAFLGRIWLNAEVLGSVLSHRFSRFPQLQTKLVGSAMRIPLQHGTKGTPAPLQPGVCQP